MKKIAKRLLVTALTVGTLLNAAMPIWAEQETQTEIGPGVEQKKDTSESSTQDQTQGQNQTQGQADQSSAAQTDAADTVLPVDEAGWAYNEVTKQFNGIKAIYQYIDGDKIRNVRFFVDGIGGTTVYRTSVRAGDTTNYMAWDMNGELNGVTMGGHWIDGIQLNLADEAGYFYDIWYSCTMKQAGKLGWAKNGEKAGAPATGDYITDIEVQVLPKGSAAPGTTVDAYYSLFHDRFERLEDGSIGYKDPNGNSYSGWLDDGKGKFYVLENRVLTGWQYIDGLKFYFQEDGRLLMDTETLIGQQSNYLVKINKQMNCLTIYAKDGNNGYIIPVKAMLTSVGDDTPVGSFKTPEKFRWRQMVTGAYAQYATRIKAGTGYLLHSVIFDVPNNRTLWTGTYNELGIARSLGCIRLTTANAKWIYDNCPIGTTITVYNDSVPGPFYKPEIIPIPNIQNWDPTDPAISF